jgi:RNA recognition motif-containing protein
MDDDEIPVAMITGGTKPPGYHANIKTYEYDQIIAFNKKTILYVGGLDEKVSEETLKDTFIAFGEVVNVMIPKDPGTDSHRGFGFVEFEDAEDAKQAMDNMMDAEIYGRVIKVNVAKPNAMKSQAIWSTQADDWFQGKLGNAAVEGEGLAATSDPTAEGSEKSEKKRVYEKASDERPITRGSSTKGRMIEGMRAANQDRGEDIRGAKKPKKEKKTVLNLSDIQGRMRRS